MKEEALHSAFSLFENVGVNGVFAELCEYKTLKTKTDRVLILTVDPSFGKKIIDMCNGDIPSHQENSKPVVVLSWDDFQKIARR